MSNKKWKMGQIFVVFSEYLDFNFGRRYEKSHYAFLISAQSGALDWMFDLKIKSWKEFRKLTFLLFFCTHIFFFFFAVTVTNHPSNESELQIYRVLQRANLLSYYDTFIAQGKYKSKTSGFSPQKFGKISQFWQLIHLDVQNFGFWIVICFDFFHM